MGAKAQADARRSGRRRLRSHWMMTALSSKGRARSARIWKEWRPLPAIRTASPGEASERAISIAWRRSDSTRTRRAAEPGEQVVEDGVGVLGPRVVGRQDHAIGARLGGPGQVTAGRADPVPLGAEDEVDPAGTRRTER